MIRKFFASLLVILIINLLYCSFLNLAIFETYLNPDFYSLEIGAEISSLSSQLIAQKIITADQNNPYQEYFSVPEIENEIKGVLSPSFFQNTIHSFLQQIENYSVNHTLEISLQEIKEKLPITISHLAAKISSQIPVCTKKNISKDPTDLSCRPPQISESELAAQIENGFGQQISDYLPNKIDLNESTKDSKMLLAKISIILKSKHQIYLITFGINIFLFIVLSFLLYPPLHRSSLWLGSTSLFSGLALLITDFILVEIPKIIAIKVTLLTEYLSSLEYFLKQIGDQIYHYSILMFIISFLFYLLGFLLKYRSNKTI